MSVDVEHVRPPVLPRNELVAFIAEQEGRIGDAYRLTEQGLSARAIGDELNVESFRRMVGRMQEVPGDSILPGVVTDYALAVMPWEA
ncbi:hypothetical protein J1G42_02965 [Cellulomonas sp. zg-ZUI222]|nr:hypothetical protein [Cellulomonas wangleii]MBO0919786.1 hypothetical protein [Cellulomonas wangleii]